MFAGGKKKCKRGKKKIVGDFVGTRNKQHLFLYAKRKRVDSNLYFNRFGIGNFYSYHY